MTPERFNCRCDLTLFTDQVIFDAYKKRYEELRAEWESFSWWKRAWKAGWYMERINFNLRMAQRYDPRRK